MSQLHTSVGVWYWKGLVRWESSQSSAPSRVTSFQASKKDPEWFTTSACEYQLGVIQYWARDQRCRYQDQAQKWKSHRLCIIIAQDQDKELLKSRDWSWSQYCLFRLLIAKRGLMWLHWLGLRLGFRINVRVWEIGFVFVLYLSRAISLQRGVLVPLTPLTLVDNSLCCLA